MSQKFVRFFILPLLVIVVSFIGGMRHDLYKLLPSVLKRVPTTLSFEKGRSPGLRMPKYTATVIDNQFLEEIRRVIVAKEEVPSGPSKLRELFRQSSFPKEFYGFALAAYQPGEQRILIVRRNYTSFENIRVVINRVPLHARYANFNFKDPAQSRIQIDFMLDVPKTFVQEDMSQISLTDTRFELGIDGIRAEAKGQSRYYLPGDAFVKSHLSLKQVQRNIHRGFEQEKLPYLVQQRFQTESYVSFQDHWIRLYRGYPTQGSIDKADIEALTKRAVQHVAENQKEDGRFFYYYNASRDSLVDHEHRYRDPQVNPYYNMLRHSGGGLLYLYEYRYRKDPQMLQKSKQAIDFLIKQTQTHTLPDGRAARQVFYNRKSKLGGSGVGLYLLSEYLHLSQDQTYLAQAREIKNHILSQILPTGEFLYYAIYLEKPVKPSDNQRFFSFYYPGEAVIGLAKYYKYIASEDEKEELRTQMKKALQFLFVERPKVHKRHYTTLPSDSWLMMAVNEVWDIPEMREDLYKQMIFKDADTMTEQMYTIKNAPYPDYAGAFYYYFGDFPYADGARAEGLLGAFELAVKVQDYERIKKYGEAIKRLAWAMRFLANTPESVYSLPNPDLAIGGIRFKHTRQWFRIDTTQHVAAFYLKLLPHLE